MQWSFTGHLHEHGHPVYLQIRLHGRLYIGLLYHARSRKPCPTRTGLTRWQCLPSLAYGRVPNVSPCHCMSARFILKIVYRLRRKPEFYFSTLKSLYARLSLLDSLMVSSLVPYGTLRNYVTCFRVLA